MVVTKGDPPPFRNDPEAPAAAPRKAGWRASPVYAALLLCLIFSAVLNVRSDSSARSFFAHAVSGEHPPIAEAFLAMDRKVAAAGEGDLFFRFLNLDPGEPLHETFVSAHYYRAVYALFPRKVHVSDERQVINNGRDVIRFNFDPGPAWFTRRQVGTVVTFYARPDGTFGWNARALH